MPLDLAKCLKFAVNFILIGRGWDFVFHRFSLVCSGEKKNHTGGGRKEKNPGAVGAGIEWPGGDFSPKAER